MIELNLLPDVKLEFIKTQRMRQLVLSTSILVGAISVALLVLLLIFSGLQKKHLNDLGKDIKSDSAKLEKQPEISKILTVQNQLQSLTSLHDQKPASSRLFDFLNQVTPTQVDVTNLTTDFTASTISVTGTANSLSSVNKYIDTLKFTKYTIEDEDGAGTAAFSNIVLSSFSLATGAEAKGRPANYTITLQYDTSIFDITKKISLSVPNQTTTRSAIEKPSALFQASANDQGSN